MLQEKELKSFWENQNVAVIFFRRWGCMFCRLWAKEVSSTLLRRSLNFRLVPIGDGAGE
jgi:thioredoxin-related protein